MQTEPPWRGYGCKAESTGIIAGRNTIYVFYQMGKGKEHTSQRYLEHNQGGEGVLQTSLLTGLQSGACKALCRGRSRCGQFLYTLCGDDGLWGLRQLTSRGGLLVLLGQVRKSEFFTETYPEQ